MSQKLYVVGDDNQPVPVPVEIVTSSFWQSIAIFVGAMASLATLYSVVKREHRRRG